MRSTRMELPRKNVELSWPSAQAHDHIRGREIRPIHRGGNQTETASSQRSPRPSTFPVMVRVQPPPIYTGCSLPGGTGQYAPAPAEPGRPAGLRPGGPPMTGRCGEGRGALLASCRSCMSVSGSARCGGLQRTRDERTLCTSLRMGVRLKGFPEQIYPWS